MFQDLVNFESSQDSNPLTTVVVISNHAKKAKKKDPSSYKRINKNINKYNHKNGKISTTNLLKKSCSCKYNADRCIVLPFDL